jgi:hypothetical protein
MVSGKPLEHIMNLITVNGNAKLRKRTGKTEQYNIAGLTLAPFNHSGYQVCPHAGACAALCVLWFAGRTVTRVVREAAIRRTKLLFSDRKQFIANLNADLYKFANSSYNKGLQAVARLNVASDLAWELINPALFLMHVEILFYDYTKDINRIENQLNGKMPLNYELIYSYNEKSNLDFVNRVLKQGFNVAMVFDTYYNPTHRDKSKRQGKLPEYVEIGDCVWDVVDGDKHDIRRRDLDGYGVIVGLRGKGGKAKVRQGVDEGFVICHPQGNMAGGEGGGMVSIDMPVLNVL